MNQEMMMKMKKQKKKKDKLKKDALEAFNKAQEKFKKPNMKILKLFKFFLIIFYIYVMRYTEYKKLIKVSLFGKDDIWLTNSDSLYIINGNFKNCERCRYLLNGALNDILLSKNAG